MLFLNAFAIVGAMLGLANAALAWRIYGTAAIGDSWMMAIAITQSFTLLSQLGVEQVAVFSAEARADSQEAGDRFDRHSLTWALLFGIGFSSVILSLSSWIVTAFASGFSDAAQAQVRTAFTPLLLQVAVAPSLFVLRQQLLLKGRTRLAVVLNNVFGLVQFLVLIFAWHGGTPPPERLAWSVGLGCVSLVMTAVFAVGEKGSGRQMPKWSSLSPFIRASLQLRFTHSIHNFLVVLLMNSALSAGVPGTVARFQYVKKVADGLSAISVGPHLSVYHAAQAQAWAVTDCAAFARNLRSYLLTAIPLLLGATGVFLVLASMLVRYLTDPRIQAAGHEIALLLVLLGWQTVIAIESIPAGVLVIQKRTGLLMAVNGIYVAIFFSAIEWLIPRPYSGLSVAATSLGCQLVSFLLFSIVATKLYRRKFGADNRA
jgi:hypothetical protein